MPENATTKLISLSIGRFYRLRSADQLKFVRVIRTPRTLTSTPSYHESRSPLAHCRYFSSSIFVPHVLGTYFRFVFDCRIHSIGMYIAHNLHFPSILRAITVELCVWYKYTLRSFSLQASLRHCLSHTVRQVGEPVVFIVFMSEPPAKNWKSFLGMLIL